MPDPQSPKVDERRWVLQRTNRDGLWVSGPRLRVEEIRVEVVPASLVDELRAERDDARLRLGDLCPEADVCKRCPCAGEDDACFSGERLRAERDALRAEVERLEMLNAGHRQLLLARAEDLDRIAASTDHRDANARLKSSLLNERAEVARLQDRIRELEDEGLRLAGLLDPTFAEGARQERERLMSDSARSVVADFFDAWRFCPASRSDNSPRPLLEDAAAQLLTALAAVLSEEGASDGS